MKWLLKTSLILILFSCANIVAPSGGDKDQDAPQIISIIDFHNNVIIKFNEFIQFNNWEENFYVSPPLSKKVIKKIKNKELHLTIEDTLLEGIRYNLILNNCIKDLNEGNILKELTHTLTTSNVITDDTFSINGILKDAYSLEPVPNAWVLIYTSETHDSLLFNITPNYVSKTNKQGQYSFPNLNKYNYKIVALTGFDFIYNNGNEIAFHDKQINAKVDTFIPLYLFKPFDMSAESDSIIIKGNNELDTSILDSTINNELLNNGKLKITTLFNGSCIIQLLKNQNVVKELSFLNPPYVINKIPSGRYQLKFILDFNKDKSWSTGSWQKKTQPEKVINYTEEIIIRSNWDLEIDWAIEE